MAKVQFLVICLFLAIFSLTLATTQAQRSSYGEPCDETLKCDKRAWLSCRNGTCECMKPDTMMYEPSLEKCASKSGERCKFMFEELDDNNVVYEIIDCVKNSKCGPEGFCTCDSKFYEALNGTCTLAQSHLESCDSQVKCSTYETLHCQKGVCKCNESTSEYFSSTTESQCVGLAGESCINSKCIDQASCSSSNECQCDDGYYQDENKKCLLKISVLKNCTRDNQCMNFRGSQLLCLNGVCNCDPSFSRYGHAQKSVSSHRYYDCRYDYCGSATFSLEGEIFDQCLGLAGSPCLDRLCVNNAICNHNSDTCNCQGGFTKSKYGNCAHGFSESCQSADGCIDGLVCKQKSCRCPFKDQIYEDSSRTCTSIIDGPCNSTSPCVDNAECRLFSKTSEEAGHCSCKKGFIKNARGTCSVEYGQPCGNPSSCDSVAALVCINEVCQCDDFAKYSHKERKCLGLVGAPCNLKPSIKAGTVNETEMECVENSHCARIHPRLQGTCTCLPGFKETPKYTCEPSSENAGKGPNHDEE